MSIIDLNTFLNHRGRGTMNIQGHVKSIHKKSATLPTTLLSGQYLQNFFKKPDDIALTSIGTLFFHVVRCQTPAFFLIWNKHSLLHSKVLCSLPFIPLHFSKAGRAFTHSLVWANHSHRVSIYS